MRNMLRSFAGGSQKLWGLGMALKARDWALDGELRRALEAARIHRGLGIYLYLLSRGSAFLDEVAEFYRKASGSLENARVNAMTQLRILERKGLVRRVGKDRWAAIYVDGYEAMFDVRKSRAVMISWARRDARDLLGIGIEAVERDGEAFKKRVLTRAERVRRYAERLAGKGYLDSALDLIAHTLLGVRKTGVLWAWLPGDIFIYYEGKTGFFHAVQSSYVGDILRGLGIGHGILAWHTSRNDISHRIVKTLFHSFPEARRVAEGLWELGLIRGLPPMLVKIYRDYADGREAIFFTAYRRESSGLIPIASYWIASEMIRDPKPLNNRREISASTLGVRRVYE
jgi:hypothetical protein